MGQVPLSSISFLGLEEDAKSIIIIIIIIIIIDLIIIKMMKKKIHIQRGN
jgi:hypothetical protein